MKQDYKSEQACKESKQKKVSKVLTIAGSDSGGGAGIQADMKTMQALHVYSMTAITAVTAQNTTGVQQVFPVSTDMVVQQITSVSEDIGFDAVKTGMLYDASMIEVVAHLAQSQQWQHLVMDPVMMAKGGAPLLKESAVEALKQLLIPCAFIVTPNLPEAEKLSGISIHHMEDVKKAAQHIAQLGAKHVLIKGGHANSGSDESTDVLYDGSEFYSYTSKRVNTTQSHGTGCTLSAAIAAWIARGESIYDAVQKAKAFIDAALSSPLHIGTGHGPTNHWAYNNRNEPKWEVST
ncbi:bifunctional hydroxymethylpyrimidine kinase/phosphomethylpyrimidine kinase [Longirhabdus pacifica]|uniref:bifunctional hydroxymethylpyrimidine kinase/phosphomethylpyrimidine kinase n=1 Tax=Longirhabdus pacifica TaxID=2305227 RepID=UPI0010092F18|nr:bifunctional hydroxymethylpyrimidine kinase/phosphomethylpyrimidine kinase [Longirhabdus pacifica]